MTRRIPSLLRRGGRGGAPVLGAPPPPIIVGPLTDIAAFFLGHSLLGFEIPNIIERFAEAMSGISMDRDVAIGVGANLQFHWNNPGSAGGDNPSVFLQANAYNVVVLVEAVPIENQIVAASSVANALNFMNLAHAENPSVQVFLCETWEDRSVTNWRQSIDARRTYYEQIVEGARAGFAGADIRVIPGGQAVGALVDAINASAVPGVSSPDELFVVEEGYDIHPTDLLAYFLGCVHFACIYQRTPVGLPAVVLDQYGGSTYASPSTATAAALQAIAWAAVQAEPYSGVDAVLGVPTIIGRSPASIAVDVDVLGDIVVTFSEVMNAATIYGETVSLYLDGVAVGTSVVYSGSTATLTPSSPLEDYSEYTVVVSTAVQDDTGVNFAAHSAWSFTTGEGVVVPTVSYSYPGNGSTAIAPWSNIDIVFNDAMDAATINASTFLVTQNGSPVAGAVSYSGLSATFNPAENFGDELEYDVTLIGAESAAGVPLPDLALSFTSVALTPPFVFAESPVEDATGVAIGTTIVATFSEDMGYIDTSTFSVSTGGSPIAGAVIVSNAVVTFTPASDLAAGTTYTVLIENVYSGFGVVMAAPHTWDFTTA